jgi:hypothetical protein
MRRIFRFLDSALGRFRKRLTREKALRLPTLAVIAMTAKDGALAGSINLDPDANYCLLHLFHSAAWVLSEIWNDRARIAAGSDPACEGGGRLVIIGGHAARARRGAARQESRGSAGDPGTPRRAGSFLASGSARRACLLELTGRCFARRSRRGSAAA